MNRYCKTAKVAFLRLGAGLLFLSAQASAQTEASTATKTTSPQPKEEAPDPGWHFAITPYIWFSGINGTTGVLGHDASVHADFSDIFSYLNMGALVSAEARHGRIVIPVDFVWMKLSHDKVPAIQPVEEGSTIFKAEMTEILFTPKIGYRVVDKKRVKVDALIGLRYWHLSTDLTVQPPIENGSFSDSASWVDGLGGAKIELGLTRKLSLTVGGDAGGGSARSDYQYAGIIGYQLTRRWVLLGGYRYLSVNYRPNGYNQFVYDVNMPGLVVGATFNIK